jgi:hypothetical protein
MKGFKRFLKEEYQGPGDLERLQQFMDVEREGKELNSYYYYNYVSDNEFLGGLNSFGGSNTSYNGFFGGVSYFNASQPLLDTFDFNGDGIIGPTDGALMGLVARTFLEWGAENGYENLPQMSAAYYRENWEQINQEYGFDLPEPSSWTYIYGSGGNLILRIDSNNPSGMIDFENITFNQARNNFWSWWASGFYSLNPEAFIRAFGLDVYSEIVQVFDYNNDGLVRSSGDPSDPRDDYYTLINLYAIARDAGLEDRFVNSIPRGHAGMIEFVQYVSSVTSIEFEIPLSLKQIFKQAGVNPNLPPPPPPPPQRPEEPPIGGEAPPPRG